MRVIECHDPIVPTKRIRLIPTKRIRCKYCGSLFEFEKKESRVTGQMGIIHDGLKSRRIKCPVCENTLYFEWEELTNVLEDGSRTYS